ncbi:MAG: T9SS type A sorting domain-containing protein [Prevotellaceae bacterium]|jgi:hypothetical protein|nr:T9SS type A sorting domain-containing protein [Prevotellaceae bacterium]
MRILKSFMLCILSFSFGLCQITYGQGKTCGNGHIFTPHKPEDPNEILGTSGYGTENYIVLRDNLFYTIYFENDAIKATAPAQEIEVINFVDVSKYDTEYFSFGTFTFRNITIEATPAETTEFSRDVDMRPQENIIVRIQGTFDKTTGEVRCYMIALDPETMDLTENPMLGILYPNTEPPIGEANFTYRIGLRQDLASGTVISNQAEIIFDLNEPIVTNPYINTIDIAAPTSRVLPLFATTHTVFTVSWSGTDEGSGIQYYNVYVQTDSSDFVLWQYNTTEISAEFTGEAGKTYSFYSLATDNVGNMESQKSEAETSIKIEEAVPNALPAVTSDEVRVYPNPAKEVLYIESANVIKRCSISNADGKTVYLSEAAGKQLKIDMGSYPSGVYVITVTTDTNQIVKVVVK